VQEPSPQLVQSSPVSTQRSPETASDASPLVAVSARFCPPQSAPPRPAMPMLRLPEAGAQADRHDALFAPRGTPRKLGGSSLREAPPLPTPRSARDRSMSPSRARAARLEEDVRLYLEGMPAQTPRYPNGLPTTRGEKLGRPLLSSRGRALTAPGMLRADLDSKVSSFFIRNITVKTDSDNLGRNFTERHRFRQVVNKTCGAAAPLWNRVKKRGCTLPTPEGSRKGSPSRASHRTSESEGTEPAMSSDPSPTSAGAQRRCARTQLHALVARGRIILRRTGDALDAMSTTITRCERYFGGLSSERKDGGGVPLLCAAAEVLAAFQQAWEEVHRDDRWARFLPLTSVRMTARAEATTSRRYSARRKFSPRRSLP